MKTFAIPKQYRSPERNLTGIQNISTGNVWKMKDIKKINNKKKKHF